MSFLGGQFRLVVGRKDATHCFKTLTVMPLLKDAVEQVVDRLNAGKKPSSHSVKRTQDAFRLMNLRHRKGTISRFDNDLGRAAALLEYTVREEEGRTIPMKLLAAAAGNSAKNLIKLHQIIGNFRDISTNPKSSSSSSVSSLVSSKRRGEFSESSIPALSIKLGALVHDPSGFAHRAQKLFDDMQAYAKTQMGRSDGRGQLYDMQRYQKAYEAACFYLIAIQEKPSSDNQYSKRFSSEVGEEDKKFGIDSIVEACQDITPLLFRNVLQHTENLLNGMKEGRGDQQVSTSADNTKTHRSRTKFITTAKHGHNKLKQPTSSTSRFESSTTQEFLESIEKVVTQPSVGKDASTIGRDSGFMYPRQFLDWRKTVLTRSRALAREAIENETGATPAAISDSRAITHAADSVLRQWGCLPMAMPVIYEVNVAN